MWIFFPFERQSVLTVKSVYLISLELILLKCIISIKISCPTSVIFFTRQTFRFRGHFVSG